MTGPRRAQSGWRFVVAFFIDLLGAFVVLGVLVAAATGNLTSNGFQLDGAPALLLFALVIAYFVVMNRFLGGTLGKRLLRVA